jgi:hypothetical protein
MSAIFAIAISIGCIFWSLSEPIWAWMPILVLALAIRLCLTVFQSRKINEQSELSPSANLLLKEYLYFYELPSVCKGLSSVSSIFLLCSICLGAIGVFQGFWWGIGIAILLILLFNQTAKRLNPSPLIQNDPEILSADVEVRNWLLNKSKDTN